MPQVKIHMANSIISEIVKYTQVDVKDINLAYYELNPDNYFGGTTHKYIEDLKKHNNFLVQKITLIFAPFYLD